MSWLRPDLEPAWLPPAERVFVQHVHTAGQLPCSQLKSEVIFLYEQMVRAQASQAAHHEHCSTSTVQARQ